MAKKLLEENMIPTLTAARGRQQTFYWDKGTAGLGLRVTSKGKRAWVYRWSQNGRDRRITLAEYPSTSLEAARQAVATLREQPDPAAAAQPAGEGYTLGDLWREFEERYLPRRSAGHQRNMRFAFEKVILPGLGTETPLGDLTWLAVDTWHRSMGSTPAKANRALAILRKAINEARRWGRLERGTPNPAVDHEAHREKRPGRAYSDTEMEKVGKALVAEEDAIIRTALKVYLVSGWRPAEVCRLRWEDIGEGGVVQLAESKTGPRVAILSTVAEEWVATLPRIGDFVFPGKAEGEPLGGQNQTHGLMNVWKRVRTHADLPKLRLYDARHTWVSTAAGLGIGDDVRRVLAGHSAASGSAHGVYLHATPALREAADQVAGSLAKRFGLAGSALEADLSPISGVERAVELWS